MDSAVYFLILVSLAGTSVGLSMKSTSWGLTAFVLLLAIAAAVRLGVEQGSLKLLMALVKAGKKETTDALR